MNIKSSLAVAGSFNVVGSFTLDAGIAYGRKQPAVGTSTTVRK